jgi:hypothetical protein
MKKFLPSVIALSLMFNGASFAAANGMTLSKDKLASDQSNGQIDSGDDDDKDDDDKDEDDDEKDDDADDENDDDDDDENDDDDDDENEDDDDDDENDDHDDDEKDDHDDDKKEKYGEGDKKQKGIEKALENLLKVQKDDRGNPDDAALNDVIQKLSAMLQESRTAQTEEEAIQAVEEQLEVEIEQGTASEQEVEILVEIKIKGKKVKEAQTSLEHALKRNPNLDYLYDLLSKVYVEQGDTEKVKVFVKGEKPTFDVEPYMKDGRNLVPVRAISEALGSEVNWRQETKTVVIQKDGVTIELPLESTKVKVNGREHQIDSAAEVKQGRIMVPLRFVSEFLGGQVHWDQNSKMVIVK